jgi:hypothetical protein
MSIQTENLKGIDPINFQDLLRPFEKDMEKMQMRDQIEMLEREIDRQSTIIDALIKAIKVIERG